MMAGWITQYLYSHRGLHDHSRAPENSMAAFNASVERGFGIELDVQAAACGAPMVFHDFTLDRLTQAAGPVAALRAPELSGLKLGASAETIPPLADVLDQIGGRVPLLIEIKAPPRGPIGPLEARIASLLDSYSGPFAVQSFNPDSVAWFVENAPEFARGQIAANFISRPEPQMFWAHRLAWSKLWSSQQSHPHFVSYHVQALPCPAARAVRRARIPLICWTVRTPEQRERAIRYADSYIFEGFLPSAPQKR